jgi:serine/threonine-protein kinase
VSSEERVQGVLLLGEKLSAEPYSSGDLSLLGVVAKETMVMHENLLLRERIGEERRVRTDVLARLGPDRAGLVKECPTCGSCYDAHAQRCARDGRELTLPLPVGRVVAGRYRLDIRIGHGGMGTVYEARDLHLGRPVAIKFALGLPLQEEHALRRFRREARALASIHHPNVVSVHDYGTLEGHGAYLVMERIRGVTLREELQRRGTLQGRGAVEWFAPLLDGVAAAHEEGVIHRDLKPEHVVRMRPEHAAPVVKILDFGVAKVRPTDTASDNLTAAGTVIGTLGYMSPEQLRGADVDARSDLFAVGVMLVEALTGVRPFHGTSYEETLTSTLLEEYHLPGAASPVVELDAVLQGCLAKDRNERYASAQELRRELLPALAACPRPGASRPS